ncbi:M23 family metallopeptidase [Ramlibacter sp.]|uniref:M23 family metallopeptidase n=1 Tax=Ramlibacter sp. TaxID=1917967 RepID=UPI002CCF5E0B|nr:peptidoglycan DD-metalloendopeptidase family protein [Ramlibacter sp.]HWI82384.1 peptidoglycan DD-metalloendopeptidase family protein [Ramlibacter sp.]
MNNGFIAAGEQLLSRAAHALEHHPRKVTALIAALLLGGGSFAVASIDTEPDDVVVRDVLEAVQPLPMQEQVQTLDVHSFNLFRTETTRATDTVEALLSRLGVDDPQAAAFLRRDANFRSQLLGRAGRNVTVEATDRQALSKLTARWAPDDNGIFKRLLVERTGDGRFSSRVESAPLVPATRMGSATIRTSLFGAADEARIPDPVVAQIIDIFDSEIDFHRQLRAGDRFNVVYEALEADGEPMRTGRVLSVEFVNKGKTFQAMWFQEPGKKGAYFDLDGKTLQSSYLTSPVEFSRVTSGFAMRFHPILHQWKAHLGVDYGGAIGTPVRTVGEGLVAFAGVQNGFGNVVIVKHNATDETVYAHLSRIDVRPGQNVAQGQRVGAIGQTGWATGPHLHFEFRVNGVHKDPSVIARNSQAATLSAEARPQFDRLARAMRMQLEAAGTATALARAD